MAGLSGFFVLEDSLTIALDNAPDEVVAQAQELLLQVAERSLDYAKVNAPWEDRTGDARRGLDVAVDADGGMLYMQLFHTVDYGLWLEVIQSGNFAIIMPTLQDYSLPLLEQLSVSLGAQEV